MEIETSKLPVPVLDFPHWRVNLRPNAFQEELIPSLSKCFEIVEQTKVRLRGWDYPHVSARDNQRCQGVNWVGAWSDFLGHNEYWRMYQSGQFIHLFSIREFTERSFRSHLEKASRSHHYIREPDWSSVKGFISLLNFLYTVTEIFEFGARLCQKELYRGHVQIRIDLKGIKDFMLTVDPDRPWHTCYQATEDHLGKTWTVRSDVLIGESANKSLDAIIWFFERFGWLNPPVEGLRSDQEQFLKGLI